jgi:hypothetical protein
LFAKETFFNEIRPDGRVRSPWRAVKSLRGEIPQSGVKDGFYFTANGVSDFT